MFSALGVTLFRQDIEDAISQAKEHPVAAASMFIVAMCTAAFVLGITGTLKANSAILILLWTIGAVFLILLAYINIEKTVNNLFPAAIGVVFFIWIFMFSCSESSLEKTEKVKVEAPPPVVLAPSSTHSEYETIAQSVCTSMAIKENRAGWTFAVKRQCDSVTAPCQTICALQALHNLDTQSSKQQWQCLGAIHVYPNRPVSNPSTLTSPSIGFKVYWSPSYHEGQHCGPNYCCCLAAV